jgi:hypothetical protein
MRAFGDPKVPELNHVVLRQKYVLSFHISMQHPQRMHVLEGGQQLEGIPARDW